MREFTVIAESTSGLSLMLEWLTGESDDGVEFQVACGAGLGNTTLRCSVTVDDNTITETIDIRPLVEAWVTDIVEEVRR